MEIKLIISPTDRNSTNVFPIEALPVELVQKICSYLDHKSLSRFALTDKFCHSAAIFHLFKTICINVYNAKFLADDTATWYSILSRRHALKYVRFLKLEDGAQKGPCESHGVPRLISNSYRGENYRTPGELKVWTEAYTPQAGERMAHWGMRNDAAWEKLAFLISSLPSLRHVRYGCSDMIANCVLRSLHRIQPRIHLDLGWLDLNVDVDISDRSPVEQSILPLLSSFMLKLHISEFDGDQWDNATVDVLNHILPKTLLLRRIRLWCSMPSRDASVPGPTTTRPDRDAHIEHQLLLTEFHLRLDTGSWDKSLQYWSHRTDFRELVVLKLEGPSVVKALIWLMSRFDRDLLNVKVLVLSTWFTSDDFTDPHGPNGYHAITTRFLQNLRGLSKLRIIGDLSATSVAAALEYHGSTLRQLWLESHEDSDSFVFDISLIDKLCEYCQILEDLSIPLKRSKGDQGEAQIFKRLGTISSLRRINLNLDISKTYSGEHFTCAGQDPSFGNFENRRLVGVGFRDAEFTVPFGNISNLFINAAIDRDLVLQIFDIMSAGKKSGAPPIETLVVRPNGKSRVGNFLPDSNLMTILAELSQTWWLQRDVRDTHRENPQYVLMKRMDRVNHWSYSPHPEDGPNVGLKEIFHKLWPQKQDSGDVSNYWMSQWKSFPIDTTGMDMKPVLREVRTLPPLRD